MKKWAMYSFKKVKGRFVIDWETTFKENDPRFVFCSIYLRCGKFKDISDWMKNEYKGVKEEVKSMRVSHTIRKKVGEGVIVVMRIK